MGWWALVSLARVDEVDGFLIKICVSVSFGASREMQKIEGVMSEISNITPAAIPAPRSQSFNMTSESSRVTVSVATPAVSSLATASTRSTSELQKVSDQDQLSVETVKAAVVAGNTLLKAANNNLQFQVDEATKQVVIKVVDSKSGEVIRQIPTVEMLDFIRAMKQQETNSGKLYQAKA